MTTLREAAQQALEALEFLSLDFFMLDPISPGRESTIKAITALRSALAESGRDWSLLEATQESLREHMAEIHRLRAALAQQDEPVQEPITRLFGTLPVHDGQQAEPEEPVAWIYQNMYTEQEYLVWKKGTGGRNWRPLYTAPPQRKPLTGEEIDKASAQERDALLEVLKYLDKEFRQHGRQHWPEAVRVRAAIKAVEEGK